MKSTDLSLAAIYLRLSDEDTKKVKSSDSSSIETQRAMIHAYCERNGIVIVKEFVDDGWSGGNFDRPDFQAMLRWLELGKANMVITKDLSRLGRDMREASYYSEQYFPEHGIKYLAISDNFDSETDNMMAPFLFAMNEVYLRDGSRKVKEAMKSKRESGQYCACPPYGYKKDPRDKHHLTPDENTYPVVQRIFACAAAGDSARKIALMLNEELVTPPMKYRIERGDNYSDQGRKRASDTWNYTTVKRILKNQVYLGHTLLGRTKKVSVKSKMKVPVPEEEWVVTKDTHPALVEQSVFDAAQRTMERGTKNYLQYDHFRKSIFSGIAVCGRCGGSLCTSGTVYKGERAPYWFLACTHQRFGMAYRCEGVRVRYSDLLEIVADKLNEVLQMNDDEKERLRRAVMEQYSSPADQGAKQAKIDAIESRLRSISKAMTNLYVKNADGRLDDEQLDDMIEAFTDEQRELKGKLQVLKVDHTPEIKKQFESFFRLLDEGLRVTPESLTWETVNRFIDKIVVGPKIFPEGKKMASHRNSPFQQNIEIHFRFVGSLSGGETIEKLNHEPYMKRQGIVAQAM